MTTIVPNNIITSQIVKSHFTKFLYDIWTIPKLTMNTLMAHHPDALPYYVILYFMVIQILKIIIFDYGAELAEEDEDKEEGTTSVHEEDLTEQIENKEDLTDQIENKADIKEDNEQQSKEEYKEENKNEIENNKDDTPKVIEEIKPVEEVDEQFDNSVSEINEIQQLTDQNNTRTNSMEDFTKDTTERTDDIIIEITLTKQNKYGDTADESYSLFSDATFPELEFPSKTLLDDNFIPDLDDYVFEHPCPQELSVSNTI